MAHSITIVSTKEMSCNVCEPGIFDGIETPSIVLINHDDDTVTIICEACMAEMNCALLDARNMTQFKQCAEFDAFAKPE